MKNQNNIKNNLKKGIGLVEVLIALVLISTSMILAIRTVSRGLKISKDNEIRDISAGVLLRALEFNQLDIPDTIINWDEIQNQGVVKCFSLQNVPEGSGNIFDGMQPISNSFCQPGQNPEISTCADDSVYFVDTPGAEICNQIIFTNYPLGEYIGGGQFNDRIRITSVVVYEIEGEEVVEKFNTFKRINSTTSN